ncbi:hypothetical protein D187_004092 [Cystobacter fuscus DSM 2262]|uniref:Uncharacterized protein n=1 Tax=Cystobacter fuscus (strain ATCC 25194 / DSM 2262 / NBRC 100088 / M29) TaxID=1242864 RepID=S9P555_CYSF2|nr:hypothetical protein [Cystobacter fuscus]EPX58336.1 hypothetical protein D187_004092 [Cystobacter fuscus DSM 2262]
MAVSLTLGTAALVLGGGLLAWLSSAPAPARTSHGPKNPAVEVLRGQLEKEPCDRTRAVQYAQALFSTDDWRESIRFSDDFVTRCGKFPQLRSISYSAHIRLSEFDLAIRDATELIESAPGNASYRVWRALAHQSRGASELALGDFQEAFRLQPEQFQVANHLATAYEQSRQPCEAHRVLEEHQRVNSDSARRLEVMEWLARLETQGPCGAKGGKSGAAARKPGKH